LIRRDVEIAPIQREGCFPTGNCGSLHSRAESQRLDLEHDFLRHILHRENARNVISVLAGAFPSVALEGHGWKFGGGKKIGGAQVVVAHLCVRGDAGHFDDRLNGAVLEVVTIHDDGALHLAKVTGHLGKKMRDGEADPGMHGIYVIGFDGRLNGRNGTERKAGNDKGKDGAFHGNFLSALDLIFGFIGFSLFFGKAVSSV
jgi:hypothetical protein